MHGCSQEKGKIFIILKVCTNFCCLHIVVVKIIQHAKNEYFSIINLSALRMVKLQGVEHSVSVVECLTRDRGAAGSNLTGTSAFCPSARHINPSLVLVQPRKTCSFIIERVLMVLKESIQTNSKEFVHSECKRVNNFYHTLNINIIENN